MVNRTNLFLLFSFVIALGLLLPSSLGAREGMTFNEGWRFFKGDASGAEKSGFNDSTWRQLDLPHDWSIEGPFAKTNKTGGAGAWAPSGVGWYRKSFAWENLAQFSNHLFFVEFDGIMQNSDAWFNGHHLGHRPNGYVGLTYELTPYLEPGKTNVLAVRCDTAAQPASRWYSGAGIYRQVRFYPLPRVHLDEASPFVSTPFITATSAVVHAQSTVWNKSDQPAEISVEFFIWPPGGNPIARTNTLSEWLAPGASAVVTQVVTVAAPQLWSLEHPVMYQAVSRVRSRGELIHVQTAQFGIRDARFTAADGFMLNGKKVLLKGVCLHHDGSAFGAAVPLAVWERRLTNLRELGVNAIRTAHNPVAPEFLDLCDRMGFLVMDEFFDCWTVGKNPHDYHLDFEEWFKRDAADTIRRDRNHPSVILYSIGNEIHDTPKPKIAIPIAQGLVEVCHENDSTRPVTQALFRPNVSGDYTNGLADLLDVVGTNYRDNELLAAQRNKPERKIVGTEQRHDRQTWLWLRDNPSHSGQFLWTGVDYLGETKTWPRIGHPSGLLDRTGEIKPMAFERQSWWSAKPMVRMARRVAANDVMPEDPGYGGEERHTQVQFADWTPRNLESHDENVEVYSNCEEVELFLNGKSLGTKPINKDASPRTWKVTFSPGILKAVARNVGKEVASDGLRTAGAAVKIILATDRKQLSGGWDEVAFVRATVVDENGVVVPRAKDLIRFSIAGSGVIAAVDSADNASVEPFQATERRAYQGVCFAMIKTTQAGKNIVVTAEADGLRTGSVAIETPRK